jgi:hypothetical protein
MTIPVNEMWVGEEVPFFWSFTPELLRIPGQTISTPTCVSQDLSFLTVNGGTPTIVTTTLGQANGLTNDGVRATLKGVAAGNAYVTFGATGATPASVYEGVMQIKVKALPS